VNTDANELKLESTHFILGRARGLGRLSWADEKHNEWVHYWLTCVITSPRQGCEVLRSACLSVCHVCPLTYLKKTASL